MAFAVVYRPPAMTAEQYIANWSGSERSPVPVPAGLLFHAGVGESDEFFTLTVWDTREAYEVFAPQFKKVSSEQGFDFGEPRIVPVHHYIAP